MEVDFQKHYQNGLYDPRENTKKTFTMMRYGETFYVKSAIRIQKWLSECAQNFLLKLYISTINYFAMEILLQTKKTGLVCIRPLWYILAATLEHLPSDMRV